MFTQRRPASLFLGLILSIIAGSTQAASPKDTPEAGAQDGTYVPADGVIDGTNLKQFLNSGPVINAREMEEASIPADNLMQMPASVPNPAKEAKKEAKRQAAVKAGKNPKKTGFWGSIGHGFTNACNAVGFPVGKNDDIGIDASLSSDLPDAVRQKDGAYNPNK